MAPRGSAGCIPILSPADSSRRVCGGSQQRARKIGTRRPPGAGRPAAHAEAGPSRVAGDARGGASLWRGWPATGARGEAASGTAGRGSAGRRQKTVGRRSSRTRPAAAMGRGGAGRRDWRRRRRRGPPSASGGGGAPLEGGGEAEEAATGLATSREEGAGDWIRKEEEKRMGRKKIRRGKKKRKKEEKRGNLDFLQPQSNK